MSENIWKPHVTVAAVIINAAGEFLMVEEHTSEGVRINQPAGHWEAGESLLDAVVRETLEETGYAFMPAYLTGIYHWHHSGSGRTYLRFAFGGEVSAAPVNSALDSEIIQARWLSREQLSASEVPLRSPQVLCCIDDFLHGTRYPLDMLRQV